MKLGEIDKRTEVDYDYLQVKRRKLNALAIIAMALSFYSICLTILLLYSLISWQLDESTTFMNIDSTSVMTSFFIEYATVLLLTIGFWSLYSSEKDHYTNFKSVYDFCNMQTTEEEDDVPEKVAEPSQAKVEDDTHSSTEDMREEDIINSENCKKCGTPYRFIPEKEAYWCDTCQRYYP